MSPNECQSCKIGQMSSKISNRKSTLHSRCQGRSGLSTVTMQHQKKPETRPLSGHHQCLLFLHYHQCHPHMGHEQLNHFTIAHHLVADGKPVNHLFDESRRALAEPSPGCRQVQPQVSCCRTHSAGLINKVRHACVLFAVTMFSNHCKLILVKYVVDEQLMHDACVCSHNHLCI